MTKKDLIKIIREVVKREVQSSVKREMNEVLNEMESSKKTSIKNTANKETTFTSNTTLNDILNETAQAGNGEFDSYPEIDANSLRARFSSMQNGAAPQTDINNRPVDTDKLGPALNKALTRDYSELVKRFK